jgi:tRNA pseudouridine65 synthase
MRKAVRGGTRRHVACIAGHNGHMLPLLYRDEHLVAIAKPAGLLVHRTALDRHATRSAVQELREQLGRYVYPAHRLDRATSGVLLFALDASTHHALGAAFETRAVRKRYLAVVRGWPAPEGTIDHPLPRIVDDAAPRTLAAPEAAQPALTSWRRLATVELAVRVDRYATSRYALLELEPHTGRRHQLRRHLKHVNHPIVGDTTYGQGRHNRLFRERYDSRRLLLAAVELRLAHPVGGAPLAITARLEHDFARVVDALGWHDALPACARAPARAPVESPAFDALG